MGVYVYGLCPPRYTAEAVYRDTTVTICPIRYVYKPHLGYDKYAHLYTGPVERAWKDHPKPQFVTISDKRKMQDGDTVLEWKRGWLFVYDDPNWGGLRTAGKLRVNKIGRTKTYSIEESASDRPRTND